MDVWSQEGLQVGSYDVPHAADPGEVHNFADVHGLALTVHSDRLDGAVHADLVTILEAVGQGFLGAVDFHGDAVKFVCLDAFRMGLTGA